jgi:predicted amidophosphoribosyltransferase
MTKNPQNTCKRCGKEIEILNHYCSECRKIQTKEAYSRYRVKPEVKEAKKIYNKLYWDKPENKAKRKKYYENYKRLKALSVRHCKRCGKEIGKSKRYCAECKELQKKEIERRVRNSTKYKERRRLYCAEYYKREENKEKRKRWSQEHRAKVKRKKST